MLDRYVKVRHRQAGVNAALRWAEGGAIQRMGIRFDINYNESRTKETQRRAILQEAYNLFLMHGIEGVDMQDIAKACGIQRRSLYNYYSQKEHIALDLMKCWYNSFPEPMLYKPIDGFTGYECVQNLLFQFYDLLLQNADAICYSVHFDHFFQNDYGNAPFLHFLNERLAISHDSSLFEKGVMDGSIKSEFRGKEREVMMTISTSIFALAQRIIFRETAMKREGDYSSANIKILIDLLLCAIKA